MAPAGALRADRGPAAPVPVNRWRFWLAVAALFLATLWLLNDVLLPFVVGAAIASIVAVTGVVARHLSGRYRASSHYRSADAG